MGRPAGPGVLKLHKLYLLPDCTAVDWAAGYCNIASAKPASSARVA